MIQTEMLWATIGLIQCCDAIATSQTIIMSYSSLLVLKTHYKRYCAWQGNSNTCPAYEHIASAEQKKRIFSFSLYPFIEITFIFWMFLFTNLFPVCKFPTYIQLDVMLHRYIASWNLISLFRFSIYVHSKSLLRQKKYSVNKTHSKNWRALNRNLVYY